MFLLTTAGAFLEMLGVSMVVPLVSVVMDPQVITQGGIATKICGIFGITSHKTFILYCLGIMIVIFVIKSLFLIFMNYIRARFVYNSRLKMQKRVFHCVVRKPYEFFLNTSSGDVLRLVYNDVIYTYNIALLLLSLFSESIVSLALILVVFMIDPFMTALIALFLGVLMLIILKAIRPAVKKAGKEFRQSSKNVYKWILQMVNGIKEIKVARHEQLFEKRFAEAGQRYTEAERLYSVTSGVPRILVEMGCVCTALIIMAVMVASGKDPRTLVTAFAAFAMAAVKLIPSANKILTAANQINFHTESIDRVTEILGNEGSVPVQQGEKAETITLQKEAGLSHICYHYQDANGEILTDASMTIPAGHSVGIVGPSGAGKTTAADVLLGLLKPQKGQVLSDGVDVSANYPGWLDLVGYIPQSIFMMDGSIRENVVFGDADADDAKVWQALEEAQLADFVRNLPRGLDTQIGERGGRLSGGQRQRIGIARALYTDPQLLVFDEATSSLDNETEAAIIESINSLHGKKTMVIIAHRLQTIENCDMVYRVPGDGSIVREK